MVIVHPDDKSGEVIAQVAPGKELVGYYENHDRSGFVAVLFERDRAYVPADCLESKHE